MEDLHWSDVHSLNAVVRLAAHVAELPLALVWVARPAPALEQTWQIAAQECCPHHTLQLNLAELTDPDSRLMVEGTLRISPLPSSLAAAVITPAQGNPFFIEETLRTLIDDGAIVRQDSGWMIDAEKLRQVQRVQSGHVPFAVQSILLSRIDREPPATRNVLKLAAAIGQNVPLALLDRLLPATADLAAIVDALASSGFLLTDPAHRPPQVSFRHALQQAAAYQTIGVEERRILHRRIAQAIEAQWPNLLEEHVEQLAYHYSRSDDPAKAVEYLTRAGERARSLFLNEVAIACFERALASHLKLPAHATQLFPHPVLLASLGKMQHTVGDYRTAALRCRGHLTKG